MMIISNNAKDLRQFNPGESEALIKRGTRFQVMRSIVDEDRMLIVLKEVEDD